MIALSLQEEDLDNLLSRMNGLSLMGCDIMRFSYPSKDDENAFKHLIERLTPLVADIHFDFKWL